MHNKDIQFDQFIKNLVELSGFAENPLEQQIQQKALAMDAMHEYNNYHNINTKLN